MSVKDEVRFRFRCILSVTVKISVWRQKAPGTIPLVGQWSPHRAEWRALVSVPVRLSLGVRATPQASSSPL